MNRLLIFLLLALAAQAEEVMVTIGDRVTISVKSVEAGTPPFSYQWQKDGRSIPGATGAAYVIESIRRQDAGTYTAVISNRAGKTVSEAAIINVSLARVKRKPDSTIGG